MKEYKISLFKFGQKDRELVSGRKLIKVSGRKLIKVSGRKLIE